MKTLATLFLIVIINFNSFSQDVVQYKNCQNCTSGNHDDANEVFVYDNNNTNYETSHVTSDFGPRDRGDDHYDWHGGVDYSSEGGNEDRGDGIVAISGGTVEELIVGGAGYKYIIVLGPTNDYGYGHLFTSNSGTQRSGNFFIALTNDINPVHVVITEDNRALSTDVNRPVISPIDGNTIFTTDVIAAGATVGSIGTSINVGTISAHLHLYAFENGNYSVSDASVKNPLDLVEHALPNYNLTIWEPSQTAFWHEYNPTEEGIQLRYPGTRAIAFRFVKALV